MPFDDFFSQSNKKHFIALEGENELKEKMKAAPYLQRVAFFRKKNKTPVEKAVATKLSFLFRSATKARVKLRYQKRAEQAYAELKAGKRVYKPFFVGGYGVDSGGTPKQHRPSKRR
jgi:hypothetical protein